MNRETRRDRRARPAPETLEGRELMSVAALPAIRPGHHEHRPVHPTTPRPHRAPSIPEPLTNFDPIPIRALARVPRSAITAVVTAGPDADGSVTITGQTYHRAKVSLDLGADGTIEETTRADAKGGFKLTVTVGFGSTPVRLSATAHGHRATSVILTVNRVKPTVPASPGSPSPTPTPTPSPGTPQSNSSLPDGDYQYIYSEYGGQIVTDDLGLTFKSDRHHGRIQYAITTSEDPYSPDNPFDPNPEELDLWVMDGVWQVHGSGAEFIGQCVYTRTNNANPSLDTKNIFNVDLVFPNLQMDQGMVDVTLPTDFGSVNSPTGLTKIIQLKKAPGPL
jgi:hypothetical protein